MTNFWKFLNKIDQYGEPIELRYNGETTYKTTIGGCCTLLSLGLSIAVVVYYKLIFTAE